MIGEHQHQGIGTTIVHQSPPVHRRTRPSPVSSGNLNDFRISPISMPQSAPSHQAYSGAKIVLASPPATTLFLENDNYSGSGNALEVERHEQYNSLQQQNNSTSLMSHIGGASQHAHAALHNYDRNLKKQQIPMQQKIFSTPSGGGGARTDFSFLNRSNLSSSPTSTDAVLQKCR
ncbi:unnamed protein product, partial [Amoebophrya sp. A25]|eukprot:GSA25T00006437001.1